MAGYPQDLKYTVEHEWVTAPTGDGGVVCVGITGYAQVYGTSPSDRIRLEGSTFGATRIAGDTLPTPVSSCADGNP